LEIFENCSCDKRHFKEVLEKNSYTTWSELEDMHLKQPKDTPEYRQLVKLKGESDIARRKQFLGIEDE